ncbi:MAG: polyphosphate kinase 1 [Verrucomicrobia bacterium]|nr:polyphosphate kinase 1 [Verrucomicrobiota bacterium]MDA1066509.1 polyphosphate kinase 1 [Verrucomicrobiota bacterium]
MGTKSESSKKKVPYFNRELSWLAFNHRVLEQAKSEQYPILERVKFLSFVSSNLDEFFEIRVAGLMQQADSQVSVLSDDGLSPRDQLSLIQAKVRVQVDEQYKCWHELLVPEMRREGIDIKTPETLSKKDLKWLRHYFDKEVYPVLTPLAIDPTHPFPQIGNKTLNLIVWVEGNWSNPDTIHKAIIPVPRILSRIVRINPGKDDTLKYIFLSDIVKIFAHTLFPGHKIRTAHAFRISRNSDLYFDEEEVENLVTKIEEELWNQRKNDPVRLEVEDSIEDRLLAELLKEIGLKDESVYRINGPLNMMRLRDFESIVPRNELKFENFIPYVRPPLNKPDSIFNILSKEDILLHHPYDSFTPVVEFIEQAARDPQVFAIKQTLYRTSGDSPIIKALKEASLNGKQVTALVELKARFDEANNIQWARELEEADVHVVYGLTHLKTHCKCCLVVRREPEGLKRYCHLGSGNYNPKTAKLYSDLSFMTSHEEMTKEIADLFNTLTGFARSPKFQILKVAPFNLHKEINRLIRMEAQNARDGKPAKIMVKLNSLIDQETIDNLYTASIAGVEIILIIRGICGLVPGVKDLSENIRVISLLGRFLEHSRVYYFENGEKEAMVFTGSADWMPRNFFRRIECVFPLSDPILKKRVINDLLEIYLKDTKYAKELTSNGDYIPIEVSGDNEIFSVQEYFIKETEKLRKTLL